jgi:hypothetical protein
MGALLLTIPVMVAATMGFGGAGGLASLASGPSPAAVGDAPGPLSGPRSIEQISARTVHASHTPATSSANQTGPLAQGPGGTVSTTPSLSGQATSSSGGGGGGTTTTGGGGSGGGTTTTGGGTPSGTGGGTNMPTVGLPTKLPGLGQMLNGLKLP